MATGAILVVEDNPVNRRLMIDLLEANGYETLEAGCAEEGLALARARRPDLILMDIRLPDMDGLAATRRLKADPTTRPIPVVAVTAHAMDGDRAGTVAAGCDGYVSKPIDTQALLKTVESFLARTGCGGVARSASS